MQTATSITPELPKTIKVSLPTILVDTREQRPLVFSKYPSEVSTLPVGDYGIWGFSDWTNPAFIVERKSLEDLCGSLGNGRERFMREVEKMRGFRFRALAIEGTAKQISAHKYHSQISPTSVFGSLDALIVRAGIHVFWCGDATGAALQVEGLVEKFINGIARDYGQIAASVKASKK